MRFYTQEHHYYAGVDLHARSLYVCILDARGKVRAHRQAPTEPGAFLRLLQAYRKDLVVACECLFCRYWLADLCAREDIPFVLGHAYYMKAIHGGKAKNDRIDSHKIAVLLRGGMLPMAYVYPRSMRATRDLLRRRLHFVRKRAELLAHIQNTNTQYNLPAFEGRVDKARHRGDLLEHFGDDPEVQMSMAANLSLLETYDNTIQEMELYLENCIRTDGLAAFYLLRSIPGIGKILALTLYYEIHEIERFPQVGNFLSYARLVPGSRESDGKMKKAGGRKMGNAHLKWAFSEAAALFSHMGGSRKGLPSLFYGQQPATGDHGTRPGSLLRLNSDPLALFLPVLVARHARERRALPSLIHSQGKPRKGISDLRIALSNTTHRAVRSNPENLLTCPSDHERRSSTTNAC